jgi:hypothetical protein
MVKNSKKFCKIKLSSFKSPNEECKPTFNIYSSRNFQWLKVNKLMGHFFYLNFYSKGSKHYKTSTPKVGKPHGNVGIHFHTFAGMYLSFQKF